MNKNLRKTVLITGGTSDIGKAIAARFASEGWNVLCHYFSSEKDAKALREKIEKFGVNCYLVKANLALKSGLLAFLKRIKKFNIDSVVNNAATYTVSKHFSRLTIDEITDTFMVNTFAPMLISSYIFERMKKKNFGRIVNISSIAAKYGGSNHSMHYGSSKLALEGVTKLLAKEGAQYNVFVNTIRPGVINTRFHKKFPKNMKKRIALIPVKKMGSPGDVADMAYYLGSEKNNFITNEIISVSGGE